MGLLSTIKSKFGSDPTKPESVISALMRGERIKSIDAIKSEAAKWYPSTSGGYLAEIDARVAYFYGSMQSDMNAVLQRQFPQGFDRMKNDQLNVRLIRFITGKKASVFQTAGQFTLSKDGKELSETDPVAKRFSLMIRESMFWSAAKEIDRLTTLCQRSCAKIWWDEDDERLTLSVWVPRGVFVMPDPTKYWRVDSARVVGFSKPGPDGLTSEVLECWTKLPDGTSQHYEIGPDGERLFDDDQQGLNPYQDEEGEPLYPFVWFREDMLPAIYHLTDMDLLATNRALNARMTDLAYGERFRAHPPGFFTREQGCTAKAPAILKVGADDVGDLPAGMDFGYRELKADTGAQVELIKTIANLEAKVDGIDARAIFGDSGQAESGVALKIREQGIQSYLADKREVYREQLISLIKRMCIMNDIYHDDRPIHLAEQGLEIGIKYGQQDDVDKESVARRGQILVDMNVYTPVDVRMELTGESKEAALAAVKENKELNSELKGGGMGAGPGNGLDDTSSPALSAALKAQQARKAAGKMTPEDAEAELAEGMPGPEEVQ